MAKIFSRSGKRSKQINSKFFVNVTGFHFIVFLTVLIDLQVNKFMQSSVM